VANINDKEVGCLISGHFHGIHRVEHGKPRSFSVRIFDALTEIGNKYFQNKGYTRYRYAILFVGFKMECLIWNAA
jgi:hypothetical protein